MARHPIPKPHDLKVAPAALPVAEGAGKTTKKQQFNGLSIVVL